MLKSIELDQFVSASPLTRIKPIIKTLTLLIIAFSLILINSVSTLVFLNSIILIVTLFSRFSLRQFMIMLLTVLFAVYGIVLSQGLFYGNYPRTLFLHVADFQLLNQLISINLWREGLIYGLKMSLRFTAPFMLAYIIYLTTSTQDYLESLAKSKVPFELAFMISIAIRFIPIVYDEYRTIRIVQKLKGYRFRFGHLFYSIRMESKLVIPLFFHSLRRSKKLAESIVGRAYKNGVKRKRDQLKFSRSEYLYMTFLISLFTLLIGLKTIYFLYENNLLIFNELRAVYEFCRSYL
ncbi:MAG: energy-coupling factor transporter transmembrane protein EcfT [Calditrichaeota bacterium]|nr:energy-coupling factor transporter transmembrane protein EcfT [Calditrichota bacterium]